MLTSQTLRLVLPASCAASSSAYFVGCQTRNGPAEAGRERRLRLGDADLGAGDLGRVAADEVVHRLRGRELADRRQHAEGVAGQEDDVGRVAGDAGDLGVADELDRVGPAGVLGDAGVV